MRFVEKSRRASSGIHHIAVDEQPSPSMTSTIINNTVSLYGNQPRYFFTAVSATYKPSKNHLRDAEEVWPNDDFLSDY